VVLAKFDLGQAIAVFIFLVLPILQSLYQKLQKKRAEAEAKERIRRRREGAPPVPIETAGGSPDSDSDSDPEPGRRRGLLERLEDLVGEADGDRLGDARTQAEDARRAAEVEAERPWDDDVPAYRGSTDSEDDDAAWAGAEPTPLPRSVAPTHPAAARAAISQISDYEATGRGGLVAMGPIPTEDEAEAGALETRSLVELDAFEGLDAMDPLVDLPGLGTPIASDADATRRAPRRQRGGLAAGGGWSRAVVLSEVLGPPVSMRKAGGYAPGLDPELL